MTYEKVAIIRCDGPNFVKNRSLWAVPCHRIIEADQAVSEDWHLVMITVPGQDLCPACWDAWQDSKQLTRSQLQNWIDNLREMTQP